MKALSNFLGLLNILICLKTCAFALDLNSVNNQNVQSAIVWEAEIIGQNLQINKNKFNSQLGEEKFPFNFIGKQNFKGFYKNIIYFIDSKGLYLNSFDLGNKSTQISLEGIFLFAQIKNENSENFYRFTYSSRSKGIIWDQYKINKDIENAYMSPDGTYIVFAHGTSKETTTYFQFINDKGNIYSTHNFPVENLVFAPTGNYSIACSSNKFIVLGKSGNKIFQDEMESDIGKNIVMNKRGTSIITTKEDPYILNVYSISGDKRLNLKFDEQVCGVDISTQDSYLVYFKEVFVGSTLKYVMKMIEVKTGKELWERTLPLYIEEYPEIYINDTNVLIYFTEGADTQKNLLYIYDYQGNLITNYSFPQKPIFSSDKKYILIFNAPKIILYSMQNIAREG